MDVIHFACGALAGWSVIAVGQPLDFIKVKLQTSQAKARSMASIAK